MADEVAAPSPPSTPLPMGTFTIALGQLVLPALDAPPAESDAPPLSFWCEVSVRMGKDLNTTWWYPSSDEHKRKVATNVLQLSPASDNSEPPSFGYAQASPPFVLSDDGLILQLAKASVHLELYSGYTRERETDVLLGAASWAFLPSLFLGVPSTTRLAFPTALVECTLAFDMGFVSHFQHMKVLAVESVQVHRLPTEWRPVPKDGDDPQKLCDENTTKFSLALKLPVALSSAMPETTFTLDGRLSYDATATDPDAAWLVRFPLESPLILPLDKEGTDALVDAIESGRLVTMSLTRTLGTDVWQATAQLALDGFLTPGTLSITLREPLRKGTAPARETLEEALTKAANNEEKKKAQAALNDYENLLTRIAGHAVIYVSAGSAASLEATIYPQALVPLPPVPLPPTKSMAEYIPPRPPLPAYQSHEATATMRKEVRKILAILMKEYDGLFALPDDSDEYTLSKEDRRHKLLFHLNANGIYFEFKEKLKKALVLVIRERFPAIVAAFPSHGDPLGAAENGVRQAKTAFYAELYAYLMEEVHVVLNHVFCSAQTEESTMNLLEATASVAPDVVRAQLQSLARLAWENEVNGQPAKAVTCHMDRIALSDKHAAGLGGYQADVWMDLALFHLRTGSYDKAANCLRDCIATDQQHIGAVQAYGALLCSYRDFDGADIVLKNGLLLLKDDGRAPPAIRARSHALLAIYYATSGMDGTGNLRLHELMQALSVQKSSAFATPTAVCIEIAAYLCELRLDALAHVALELGAALRKPKTVYTSVMWSTERFVQATIQLHNDDLDGARASLQEAVAKDAALADAWYLQGVVCSRQQQLRDAITCFEYAAAHVTQLRHEYHLPLFLQLGALYMHHQQWTDAKSIFLTSVGEASNASSWLGVGVVCVRQEDWEGAEMALAEANILDNTNADVWGYLSLVCLHGPVPRPLQAEQALQQALRYNLANPTLLREISNGFVALDKLEIAESLLRRSLRAQDSSLTRKTLADVLSAQNCAETALTEYQQALASCESMEGRADLLSRCVALLETLGRKEEAHEYKAMAARQQEGAVSEGALLQSPPRDENNPASGPDDV